MKKWLFTLVSACLLLSGCCTTYAQEDDVYSTEYVESNFTYEYIILHGTPHYYNGVISYYYYAGIYYYPYLWDGYWYFQPFRHVHPIGYIFHPHRYHRPHKHLGDLHHRYPQNFGNGHRDGYRDRSNTSVKPRFNDRNSRTTVRPDTPSRQVNPSRSSGSRFSRPQNAPTQSRPTQMRPTQTRPNINNSRSTGGSRGSFGGGKR